MSEEQPTPRPDTIEVFYDLTKGVLERQIDNARDLDAKILQIFSVATIAAGLAGFSTAGSQAFRGNWADAALLALAFAAYAAMAYVSYQHLKPRRWKRLNYPAFWNEGQYLKASQVRHSVIAKVVDNYADNQRMLGEKVSTIRLALATTAVEIVLIGAALVSALAA